MIYLLYTNDSILVGPDPEEISSIIKEIGKILDITNEEEVNDFLGVHIDRKENGEIHLTQPHLIHDILKELKFDETTKPKKMPMK